jgi:anaerobic magnesium-protoporphyrin IX monomethyl ester cyclase
MKKILLINPPLYFIDGKPRSLDVSMPPLGLLYLASYINKYSDKFRTEIIDIGAEGLSLEDVNKRITEEDPFIIGISAMTPQLQGAVELAQFIKQDVGNDIKIFLGGPHVSADPDFIRRHADIFDYAITGEAEKTFLDSLNKLIAGQQIPAVQSGEVVMNLDAIPFSDKKLIKRENYSKTESMLFSRGCPYQCYYCSRPSISRIIRYRSAENLVNEIKECLKYCDGSLNFQDDTFTLNRKKVMDFCELVNKENLILNWECNTRIDLVDEELLRKMKQAGCSRINFGVESGNENLRRDVIKKGSFTNEKIREVFKNCKKQGIGIACYFMIGHPCETKSMVQETKNMILNSGIDVLGLSIPLPFPGSSLYNIACKEGIINEEIIDKFARKELGMGYAGIYPIYVSKELSPEYVFQEMKDINRKFYINFKTFWNRFRQDIFSVNKIKSDAGDLLSLIIKGVSTRKPYIKK